MSEVRVAVLSLGERKEDRLVVGWGREILRCETLLRSICLVGLESSNR